MATHRQAFFLGFFTAFHPQVVDIRNKAFST
jgi:hypothetical protein